MDHYTDLVLKPGYKLSSRIMAYGLIGPSIANWSHTTEEYTTNGMTNVTRLINRLKMDKHTVGLALGFGFEYLVQKRYAFSIDYVYHTHRSASTTQNMSYLEQVPIPPRPPILRNRSGNLSRTVKPFYSTIAFRFTTFLNL